MSSRVSRADLLMFLDGSDAETLGSVLDCFGYRHQSVTVSGGKSDSGGDDDLPPDDEPPQQPPKPLATERAPEVYYRVDGQEASQLMPAPEKPGQPDKPEWLKSIENEEPLDFQRARKRFATEPPPHQPLVNWAELWPLLHRLLSQQHTRKRPDIPRLVKLVAKAEQPRRIPQQQRQYWSAKTIILMDRPQRLDNLNQDYVQLQEQLEKQRGETGLECWFVLDLAAKKMLLGDKRKKWQPPAPDTPILILSDLGIYDSSGEATRQWLLFGKQLRQSGCRAFALVPAPAGYISDELSGCFQCISWDRVGGLKPVPQTANREQAVEKRIQRDRAAAEQLLTLASAATDIEAGFLRSLRQQFQIDKPWHIGHELLAWNHESAGYSSHAIVLDMQTHGAYRNRLVDLVSQRPELAESLYWHVRDQLAHAFTIDYVDALCFLGWLANIEHDERLDAAELYLKQFILFVHQQDQHKGLAFNSHLLLSRQDAGSLRQKKFYSSLWAIDSSRSAVPFPRPDWVHHAEANAFLASPTARQRVQLIQLGEWFYLGTAAALEALRVEGFPFKPYVLAAVEIDQDLVIAEYEGEMTDHHLVADGYLQWPVTGEPRVLHLGGQRLEIEVLVKPEWAGSLGFGADGLRKPAIQPTGEDEYGVYFDLVLDTLTPTPLPHRERGLIVQRFRYIPPQTFLMGSPEDEPGRYDRETQHAVTSSQGYWIADTTITQAFWEAVTGENPSHFEGGQRPVEQVSWNDVQAFIKQLKKHWPLLEIRLPTEAEWECACRAGTVTAFSFGGKNDLDLEKVNYSGNWVGWNPSGETKAVKSLPANQWGLYEMHGNVFEWCEDAWQENLPASPVTDPLAGPEADQGRRVVRGGSWNFHGWYCRSACRDRYAPDNRLSNLGVRLALGHVSSGQEQAGSLSDQPRRGAADKQEDSQTAAGVRGWWEKTKQFFTGDS